jgi:RimJ/RimL family protein N-acetyltransferase
MKLTLTRSIVRSWTADDLGSLVKYANNRKIWLSLRDRFPHPYTRRDGRDFIQLARSQRPEMMFAIDVDGEAAGGIGFVPHADVERVSAEIGYWLGEPFWGRGIVTEALVAVTKYAIDTQHLTRVFAVPYARNDASCRVLEKAGYVLEGRLRRSAIKDGEVIDQMQYAFIV